MIKKSIYLLFILTSIHCFSQDTTYSLKSVLKYGEKNNFEINKAAINSKIYEIKAQQIKSNLLPQIKTEGRFITNPTLSTSYLPGELAGQPGQDIEVQFGKKYEMNTNITANQLLFDAQYFYSIKIAELQTDIENIGEESTKENIIAQIASLYYKIFINQYNVKTLIDNAAKIDSLYKINEVLVENQVAKKLDSKRLKVNLINLNTNIEQLQSNIIHDKLLLKLIIGYPINKNINLKDSSITDFNKKQSIQSIESVFSNRNELKIVDYNEQLIQKDIKRNNAYFLPKISAFGKIGYNNQTNDFAISGENAKWKNFSALGINMSINIFDGFNSNREAKFKLELNEITRDNQKNKISLEIINAQREIKLSLSKIKSQEENIQLAEEVFVETNILYNQGLTKINDVLNAESELRESKNLYYQKILNFKIAELNLLKAQGTINKLLY
jgi:outer membrane protein TolC